VTPWNNREELVQRIVTLSREKVSRRAIAISLGISRNTVRQVLEEHGRQRETEHSALPQASRRAPRASKLDPYKDRVSELLDKYADITAQRIFEMLQAEGFDGGSTAAQEVRPARTSQAQAQAEPPNSRLRSRQDGRERLVPLRADVHGQDEAGNPTVRLHAGP
jgi:transposase